MAFQVPRLTWQPGDGVANTDMNRIEENIAVSLGLKNKTTVFNTDTIVETYADNSSKVTTFNADGSIVEEYKNTLGVTVTTKTSTFNADGSITEVII